MTGLYGVMGMRKASKPSLYLITLIKGPTKHRKGLKHCKGLQVDVLNTAKYDKGLDNPNPCLTLTLIQSRLSFFVMV